MNQTPEEKKAWRVVDLVDLLARPTYNLRMARAMNKPESSPSQLKSARTRQRNAVEEIDKIVRHYIERANED